MKKPSKKKSFEGTVIAVRLPTKEDADEITRRIEVLLEAIRANQDDDEKLYTRGEVVQEALDKGLKSLELKYLK